MLTGGTFPLRHQYYTDSPVIIVVIVIEMVIVIKVMIIVVVIIIIVMMIIIIIIMIVIEVIHAAVCIVIFAAIRIIIPAVLYLIDPMLKYFDLFLNHVVAIRHRIAVIKTVLQLVDAASKIVHITIVISRCLAAVIDHLLILGYAAFRFHDLLLKLGDPCMIRRIT